MRSRAVVAFILALSIVAVPGNTVGAAPMTHRVEFGELISGVPGEVLSAFPSRLQVHAGDTVHFTNDWGHIPEASVHLVALLPANEDVDEWLAREFPSPDGAYGFAMEDPDETPDEAPAAWKFNNVNMFPSHPYCGQVEQNPCDFSGTGGPLDGVVVSGMGYGVDTMLDFYARITAEPGTTIWAICPFHPGIRVRIDVVAEETELPAAQDAQTVLDKVMPGWEKKAAALHAAYVDRQVSARGPRGTRIWQAWPGLSRGPLFLVDMYPKSLDVRRGDSVRFNYSRNEIHTVSMPIDIVGEFPWVTFQCDLDTDAGPLPDIESAPLPPFCPGGPAQFEGDLHHTFPFPVGDGTFTSDVDLETSGIRGGYPGSGPPLGLSYPVRFDAPSGTEVGYMCMLHFTMKGTITIR